MPGSAIPGRCRLKHSHENTTKIPCLENNLFRAEGYTGCRFHNNMYRAGKHEVLIKFVKNKG
jgi:hypothetical protein